MPPSTADIAGTPLIGHSTASRAVNATKNARLVEQSRAFEDSRRCQVGLTERGRALVEAAFARTLQVLDEIPEGWSDDNDLCDLGRHLRRLNQGFDRIEGRS